MIFRLIAFNGKVSIGQEHTATTSQ